MKINKNAETADLFRSTIISGAIMYLIFGILDIFMLPIHYHDVWILRFGVVIPALIFLYVISYFNKVLEYGKIIIIFMIFVGQLGILIMLAMASREEEAFRAYYEGLILVMFWATAVYRLKTNIIIYLVTFSVLAYNYVAIFIQKLDISNFQSVDFAWFIDTNFFLISTSVVVVIASFYLNKYQDGLIQTQRELETNNRLLEKQNIEFEKAKIQAQKSDSLKTAFLANMGHEIRTPLNSIVGFSQLLDAEGVTDKSRSMFIEKINKNSMQLLDIINDILEISKIETGHISINYEEVKLANLFDDIHHTYQVRQAKSDVNFPKPIIDNKSKEIIFEIDRVKLQQIISNLLNNAFKFTEKGQVSFGFNIKNNMVMIFIKDTGIGISETKQREIFERFVQTEEGSLPKYGGTGIGLAICKAYTEKMDGKIWVESELAIGSTFYVSLPLKKEEYKFIP